jgi:polyisoprenoid-binding protein YceI
MAIWTIDPTHSEVHFKVKHLVISTVTGSFKTFEGTVEAEKEDFSDAKISFSAAIDSIDTNNEQRDGHLKSPDFFDAAQFPHLTFSGGVLTPKGDSKYILTGDLTLKGVTKKVDLSVEFGGTSQDFYGNIKAGFDITGKINRQDFGLTWSAVTEAGSIVVSDEVKLNLNIQIGRPA